MKENNFFETQTFDHFDNSTKNEARDIMLHAYESLREKGYNPVNQIVGYILSGDPTYITSYNNARGSIGKLERDELLEEIVTFYISHNK